MAGTGIYGELLKAQLENLASDPASTSVGRVYWNTTTQSARVYTSSGWDDLGGGGSGASGRNYLADWFDGDRDPGTPTNSITATGNITISTTAWQASDTSKLTVARTSSSPLRQTYSILLDHVATGAAFVQTPCFLLDAADLGKPVTVSFDVANVVTSDDYQVYAVRYTSGGTYQEQIPIIGTASATSPYSARIPTGTTKFQGFFIAGSTSTDYYVIRFYRNSASDTTDIKVDSLYVGPEKVVQGAAVTDWVSFTPTGSWSTNATYTGKWRRVGDSMECEIYIALSGAPTGTLSALNLPSGYTIDTAKLNQSTTNKDSIGSVGIQAAGTANYMGTIAYSSTTAVRPFVINAGGTYAVDSSITATAPNTFANGDFVSAHFKVPIVGWSSNVTMANRAVERYFYTSEAFAATGSTTVEGFAGQATTNNAGTSYTKTITHNMPGAKPFLELSTDGGVSWVDAGQLVPWSLGSAGTSNPFGCRISAATTTTVTVNFGGYAIAANDDSPTYDWGTSFNWRVRMVMPGAVTGYPIGARNIVGDTTGTAVPRGYIGESFVSVGTSGLAAGSIGNDSYTDTDMSLSLTPGSWLVGYGICVSISTGDLSSVMNLSTSGNISGSVGFVGGATGTPITTVTRTVPITISTAQTLKLRVRKTAGSDAQLRGSSITGSLTNPDNDNCLFAVRIA